jgi:predicted acylesterase/phospholipase RssA/CRP-like cAMP-binding protein
MGRLGTGECRALQRTDDAARRDLLLRLAALPLFAGMDAHTLGDLADGMDWLALPGGGVLFAQNEVSDALYVLVHGRLAASKADDEGRVRALGAVTPGECVGETGLIAGVPRSATVIAMRDSELLRLSRAAFERLIAAHPQAMLNMARTAVRRFSDTRRPSATPHCFALLPAGPGVDVAGFARRLARALNVEPMAALIEAAQARGRDPGWFSAREARSAYLIYVGSDDAAWRERCLRQSDCVLLLADAGGVPGEGFDRLTPNGYRASVTPPRAATTVPGEHVAPPPETSARADPALPRSATTVHGEPVEPPPEPSARAASALPRSATTVHGEPVEPPPKRSHLPWHLVLLQRADPAPGSTRLWLAAFPQVSAHHHVRHDGDLARLARRLTGRATGLVLSGGGARGFAHIGVVRALRDAGIEIDYVAGCSIGAIIGAGVACDWSYPQMVENYRRCFVDTNPLSDWTLPLVSLRSGRKVARLLREAFGATLDIEDLPLPFFCVSSNLTEGALEVHERGPLWRWLRASCAIPGVLPPVFANGRVLVDGGVIDNLPVAELRKRLDGEIVAVDVGGNYRLETAMEESELPAWWRLVPEFFGTRKRPSLGQILLRAGMVNSDATVQRRRRQTRLLLKPALEGIDLLEWQAFQRAIDLGYQYTLRQVGGPRDALTAEAPLVGL